MRKPVNLRQTITHIIALCLVMVLGGAGSCRAESLKVGQPNQFLFPDPDFASPTLGPLPPGAEVQKLLTVGTWFKVNYRGQKGWVPLLAFPQLKSPPENLPGLLSGAGVKAKDFDEVALAGKAEKMPPPRVPQPGDLEKVVNGDHPLYPDPDPTGAPLATVPRGAPLKILALTGEWCKVAYRHKIGWLPLAASRPW